MGNDCGPNSCKLGEDVIPYPSEIFIFAPLNLTQRKACSVIASVPASIFQTVVGIEDRSKFRAIFYLAFPIVVSARMNVTHLRQERVNILEGLIENNRYSPVAVDRIVNRIPKGCVVIGLGNVGSLIWHVPQPKSGKAPAGRTDKGSFPCLKMMVKSQGKSSWSMKRSWAS